MCAPRPLTPLLAAIALCSLSGSPADPGAKAPTGETSSVAVAAVEPEIAAVTEFLQARHTGLIPAEIARLAEAIVSASRGADLSPALVVALIHVESSGYNFAVSPVGALGLMQLRPATAEAEAKRVGVPWRGPATLFDPVANVRLGVSYLERMLARYGNLTTALAAYNWGPSRIAGRLRRGEVLPEGYSRRVLASYQGVLSSPDHRI